MKNFKIMLIILGTALLVRFGIFIYYDVWCFELSRTLIYQYNADGDLTFEHMSNYEIDYFIDGYGIEYFDKSVPDNLEVLVKGVNRNEYNF